MVSLRIPAIVLLILPAVLSGCDTCWPRGGRPGSCVEPGDDDTGDDDAGDDDSGDDDTGDDDTGDGTCIHEEIVTPALFSAYEYDFVCVHPDTYTMGSPTGEAGRDDDEAQHSVTLTRVLLAGVTEVTQGLWEGITGANPSDCEHGCSDVHPVQRVTWDDVIDFCNQLSGLDGLDPVYEDLGGFLSFDGDANGWRLPTESEWEYLARADDGTVWPGSNDPATVGWCENNPMFEDHVWPVKLLDPNGWGLYDMAGNAQEWVWDNYDSDYPVAPDPDPEGPPAGSYRVLRGGPYYLGPSSCRSASRSFNTPGASDYGRGFRLVRTVGFEGR